MNSPIRHLYPVCAILLLAATSEAEVALPAIFSDGMILQRELPVTIWGTASPDEAVSVSFAGQTVETTAGAGGRWRVHLQPLATSASGRTMTVRGSNTIRFSDVLVGEVWLCSGQSNMADSFSKLKDRPIDAALLARDLSRLRFSTRTGWSQITEPYEPRLSRVAFYFGYALYEKLGIPVGLIPRHHSGTPIQAWMPRDAAELIRKRLGIPPGWKDEKDNRNPAVQFDDKIAPIVPVTFRGVIWYQGERNAKARTGWEYRELLPFLIETWRGLWAERSGLPRRDFPFYYVQVPTQEEPVDAEWPWLRDGMRRVLDKTANTGMAVFYDYGPSLHPANKAPAGQRLALWALARDYGYSGLVHCGPLLDKVRFEDGGAVLSFTHIGGGLKSKAGGDSLKFFEIAGKDGKYQPAEARIAGDSVVVRSDEVPEPAYVRYLFRKPEPDAEVSLINAEGLPASSFMTDEFLPPRGEL